MDESSDEHSAHSAPLTSSAANNYTSAARNTCNNNANVTDLTKNNVTNAHTESGSHTFSHTERDAALALSSARDAMHSLLASTAHNPLSFTSAHAGFAPPVQASPPVSLTQTHSTLPYNPGVTPFAAPPALPYNVPPPMLSQATQFPPQTQAPAQTQYGLLIASLALSPLLSLSLISACAAQPWFSDLAVSLKRVFDTQRETMLLLPGGGGLREDESESATRCVAIALQQAMHTLQEKQLSVLWSVLGAQGAQAQTQNVHSHTQAALPLGLAQNMQSFQHTQAHAQLSPSAHIEERAHTQYNENPHKLTTKPHAVSTQLMKEPPQIQAREERSIPKEGSSLGKIDIDSEQCSVRNKVEANAEERSSLSKIDFDPDEYYAQSAERPSALIGDSPLSASKHSAERSSAGLIASIYMVPSYKRSINELASNDERDRDTSSVHSSERERERETHAVKRQKIVSPYMVSAVSQSETHAGAQNTSSTQIASPYMVGAHNTASHMQSQNISSPYMVGSHNTAIQSPYMVSAHNTASHTQSRSATSPYMVGSQNAIQSPYMVGSHTSPYMASAQQQSSSSLSFSPYFFSQTHAQGSSPSYGSSSSTKLKINTQSYASTSSLSLNSKISFYAWDGLLVEVLKHPHPELAVPPSLLPPFPADAAEFVRIFTEDENRQSLLFPHEIDVLQRLVADKETLDKEVNALRLHALHHQKKADLYKPRFGWEYLKEQLRYGRSQMLCTVYWCVCVVHLYHMPHYEALKITREQFVQKYIEPQRYTQRNTDSYAHTNSNSAWRTQSSSASASLFMDIDEMELQRLVQFRNILKIAMVILPAHRNEVLLLRVATCLERSGKKYQISSSGQMLATTRRRLIYRREGLASLTSTPAQAASTTNVLVSTPAPMSGPTSLYMSPVPAVGEEVSLLKNEESEEPLSLTHTHSARTDMERAGSSSSSSSSSLGILSAPLPPVTPLQFPSAASVERGGREDEEDLNSLSENQPEAFSQE